MQTTTTRLRLAPAFFAALCLIGTAIGLYWDVVALGAPITPRHIMTGIVLVVAVAAGHWAIPALASWRIAGIGLGLVAVGASLYAVTLSSTSIAVATADKAAAARERNDRRAALDAESTLIATRDRASRDAERRTADADLVQARADHAVATRGAARECASGAGTRCDGASRTRDAADSHVRLLEAKRDRLLLPDATVAQRLDDLGRQRSALGPVEAIDPEIGYLADLAGLLGFDARHAAALLAKVLPVILPLVLELGTIAFASFALVRMPADVPTRRLPAAAQPLLVVEPEPDTFAADACRDVDTTFAAPANTGPANVAGRQTSSIQANVGSATVAKLAAGPSAPAKVAPLANIQANVVPHPVLAAIIAAGRHLNNNELAAAMNCHPSEASRRRAEVRDQIRERRVGREVRIDLA